MEAQSPLLEELNSMLRKCSLPDFRRHVDRSGNNLNWLRKYAATLEGDDAPRIRELVALDIGRLLATVK